MVRIACVTAAARDLLCTPVYLCTARHVLLLPLLFKGNLSEDHLSPRQRTPSTGECPYTSACQNGVPKRQMETHASGT